MNRTKKFDEISTTHISYNRFNGIDSELVIERMPSNGIPTYKDVIMNETAPKIAETAPKVVETEPKVVETEPKVVETEPKVEKLSMFKRTIPKGVRWADVCDDESDDDEEW
jgi:hypothetical protein